MNVGLKNLLVASLVLFAAPAFAADEFGQRFSSAAPAALQDDIVESAPALVSTEPTPEELQNIMPAAGASDTPVVTPPVDDTPYELESGLARDSGYEPANSAPPLAQ